MATFYRRYSAEYLQGDSTPPVVNVTSSSGKISDETGKDSYAYSFQSGEAATAYEIRVVSNASDLHGQGTLIESGGSIAANTTINGDITYAELVAAGASADGSKILKFFARDAAGNWSI